MRILCTLVLSAGLLAACESSSSSIVASPAPVLLKDMEVERLPSPYYHFDYDGAGRISGASFASNLKQYVVDYSGERIADMVTTPGAASDSLQYGYDDAGHVAIVKYVRAGAIRAVVFFTFDGARLTGLERDVRVTGGYIMDKTMTFTYDAAGNLRTCVEHRPPVDGLQTESTITDTFEDYDQGINVDDFALLHDDFYDELFILPGVKLQQGNPRRVTRTGDGLNYVAAYSYTYDAQGRPTAKQAQISGPAIDGGLTSLTTFTYY